MYFVCLKGKIRIFFVGRWENRTIERDHIYLQYYLYVLVNQFCISQPSDLPFLANWPFPVLDEEWGMCQSELKLQSRILVLKDREHLEALMRPYMSPS